jgi:hypothetical protein
MAFSDHGKKGEMVSHLPFLTVDAAGVDETPAVEIAG